MKGGRGCGAYSGAWRSPTLIIGYCLLGTAGNYTRFDDTSRLSLRERNDEIWRAVVPGVMRRSVSARTE